jgi:hypothetical protein
VRDALNSALDEEMSADPSVLLMGEEVPSVTELVTFSPFLFALTIYVSVVGWGVPRCIQG